jgi:hypothetical protein
MVKLAICLRQDVALLGQLYSAKVSGVLVDFHGVKQGLVNPYFQLVSLFLG